MKLIVTPILLLGALAFARPAEAQNPVNKGFKFNETGTVKVSNFGNPAGDFSVEVWARLDATGSNTDDLISTHENPGTRKGYFLEYAWGTNNVLKAGIANSGNGWTSADYNANWQVGQWHHVVMTYNAASKTIKLYQDGTQVASNTLGSATPVFSTRPFGIGCSDNYATNGFPGTLDEVYVWDRELPAAEVSNAAHLYRPANAAGLKAYYNLDTLNSTVVADMTANGLNATAGNMTPANVVASYAPIEANPVAGYTGYKANWNALNNTANAGMQVTSAYTDEQNYTTHAHSADSGIATTGIPVSLRSRLKRVWHTAKYGSTTGSQTLKFGLADNNIVSNMGNLFLLRSNDGNTFSYYDSIPAVVSNGAATFTVPDTLNTYFTLGSTAVMNLSTLSRSVAVGTDDAEECVPGGTGTVGAIDLTSSDLEIMLDGTKKQMIGVRFANITIPQGSQVQNAYIQFSTKGDKAPVSGNAYLSIQNADNAVTFSDAAFNVTSRPRIADSVLWPGSTSSTWGTGSAGVAGPDQKTPDLKNLVQAVINRSGWASGNAMALFVTGPTGVRNANSYDNGASGAAKLIVQYIAPVTPQMPVTAFPIAKLSQWKYLDNGTNQDTAWRMPSFDDAGWAFGPGKLGYSDNPATTLGFGPDAGNKYITYYFRKPFTVSNLASLTDSLDLNILRDDGAVVFINGVEVIRSNMDPGAYNYQTHSTAIVDGADESNYFHYSVPKSVLVNGTNTIAVEIHQRDGTSSDLGFDMELTEHVIPPAPSLIRGPYLNAATPTSIVVRWRTDAPVKSRVRFGATAANLDQFIQDTTAVTEHIIKLTGLTPYTRYFYNVGSLTDTLQGDAANYFYTLPVAGLTDSLLRIGVIGDCGNNSTNQRSVRDQLSNYLGSNYMNSWILLGDNAYSSGFDAEYQAEFFNIYKDKFLKQNPLFPAPGNHDYGNSTSSPSVTNHALAPYYQNFTMPVAGEAGGTASNNPAFYSYDVGNVHFLSLDSYGKEADASLMYDTNGVQVQWIKQDLANNTNKGWVVAYWHHPPYTMGSHNSDNEGDLVQIRQKFIQILERMGVDLILCGHSHDYERSKLMKGHYGNETSFDANVHHLSSSSAMYDGSANSCPYVKDSATSYQGTVYVVSGSAGQLGGQQGSFPHNAMYYSNATNGGSMILEVKGNRLDAKWICADGVIRDQFTMMKDANRKRTFEVNSGTAVTLTAAYNGSYNWQGVAANTKSVTVSPVDTTTYVVSDAFSCISDTFVVHARATPLPVSWGYMRAGVKDAHSNLVEWQTLSEHHTAYFDVERATPTGAFVAVGQVKASGDSQQPVSYQLTDASIDPAQPLYLYRVRQADKDGKVTYSQVVPVSRQDRAASALMLAPNPARNGEMMIALNSNANVAAELLLTDVAGRRVWSRSMTLGSKPQQFLPVLQNGVYFLSVKYPGQSFTRKIVIRN